MLGSPLNNPAGRHGHPSNMPVCLVIPESLQKRHKKEKTFEGEGEGEGEGKGDMPQLNDSGTMDDRLTPVQ
jgi:hypothetical protein